MAEQINLFHRGSAEAMYDRGAILSPDGVYRYRLWRIWDDDLAPCAFVMLNPSTADATEDDPTIRRCTAFAKSWGAGGIVVVNLFAVRATDPVDLVSLDARGVNLVGPEADAHIRKVLSVADVVVCAWGKTLATWSKPWRDRLDARVAEVLALVPRSVEVCSLGVTAGGHPRHPLYLRADTPREPFGGRL